MLTALVVLLRFIGLIARGHRAVALENLALRQQLAAWTRRGKRPQLRTRDRFFWVGLANAWRDWRTVLIVVQPETVVRWPSVSIDFFTVPTLTGRVLFVFVLLAHHRRRIVHFNITEHPTAAWTSQQMIEAFPDDMALRWLLRDRDAACGDAFRRRVAGMGMSEVMSSPSSPWQNPYAERLIGSIRRECLDHVIELGERHLRRVLAGYLAHYHGARTHLSLEKDAPTPRRVQAPTEGRVVAFSEVGGLHHRYERRAA